MVPNLAKSSFQRNRVVIGHCNILLECGKKKNSTMKYQTILPKHYFHFQCNSWEYCSVAGNDQRKFSCLHFHRRCMAAIVICTCVKNIKIGSDYKESCDVDRLPYTDTGCIWKCLVIDSGSALHHFVYPKVHTLPKPYWCIVAKTKLNWSLFSRSTLQEIEEFRWNVSMDWITHAAESCDQTLIRETNSKKQTVEWLQRW